LATRASLKPAGGLASGRGRCCGASATAGALGAFAAELDALRGKHITASAYAVLSVLATHLRDQLSP